MKAVLFAGVLMAVSAAVMGCSDREAAARKAREEAEAKARADAAKREMDTLPKAFKSPQFFKLNEPEKKPAAPPSEPAKKTNP